MPHGSKALRWNRDLCSWDSWSHLFQFNKHKKLLFYLRAICKWNWKMHSSCFSNYLKKWFVLYYKTSIHRKIGKWEQTESVCIVDACLNLCCASGHSHHCTWAHSYLLRSSCMQWIEHWLKLGVYITVTINHWG